MLTLNIISTSGSASPVECDSVHLCVQDDNEGRGGGSYGIRTGHAKALFSLEEGDITAFASGKEIFRASVCRGFATVENNVVKVIVEKYKQNSKC